MAVDAQQRWYLRNMDPAGEVVADVGANVGELSQFFWDHGDAHTRLVSIEPLEQNLQVLRPRVQAAQSDRWRVEACAVSSTEGTVWIAPDHSAEHGWNAMVQDEEAPGRVEVPCRRLDDLVPEATIVKLDIEGHEYVVLDEALAGMSRVHTWAVELHMVPTRPLQATLGAFVEHGFSVVAAAQRPGDRTGAWHNAPIPPSLAWDRIPVAKRRADGSVFKMLHIIAQRST